MDLSKALDASYEKSLQALLATARVIIARRPLGGAEDEFLSLVDQLEGVKPDAFTRVWQAPYSYWWTRLAYQLTASTVGGAALGDYAISYRDAINAGDAKEALRTHLEGFKRIQLGLGVVNGLSFRFEKPYVTSAPFAIPGTRYLVGGAGPITIEGVEAGKVVGPDGPIEMVEYPVASDGELDWLLQPAAYRLPGLGLHMPDAALDLAFQRDIVKTTETALRLVRQYAPELTVAFHNSPRLIAFKPFSYEDDFRNVTHSELPGAFISSFIDEPYDLADTIVHEFFHGLLYAVEEDAPFFEPGTGDELRYYSPWRADLRDLNGVLHAYFVFLATTRFWLGLRQGGGDTGVLHDYTTDRLIRYPLQLRVAEGVLKQFGRFTEQGQAVFDEMCDQLEDLRREIAALGLPLDTDALQCDAGTFKDQQDERGVTLSIHGALRRQAQMTESATGAKVMQFVDSVLV